MRHTRHRYGDWAVVAGASEGLGVAFAESLARRGYNLILIARRAELLEQVAVDIRTRHCVETRAMAADCAALDFAASLETQIRDLDIGVGIYNAGAASFGALGERPLDESLYVVDVNCRAPVIFARALVPGMTQRGRGGLVLVSSLAGLAGVARLATYAASKAFLVAFAHGLWGELRPLGVDVLVPCLGAVRSTRHQHDNRGLARGQLDARIVAEQSMEALGGRPFWVPGGINKAAALLLGHVLSRRAAHKLMSKVTAGLS